MKNSNLYVSNTILDIINGKIIGLPLDKCENIKYTTIEDIKRNSKEINYKKLIEKYIEILYKLLIQNFSNKELIDEKFKFLKERINKEFKIYKTKFSFKKIIINISFFNNRYNILVLNDKSCLLHELLHILSSNLGENDIFSSGFHIYTKKFDPIKVSDRGVGINEGYTEYLKETLIGKKSNIYNKQKVWAKNIEKMIGREKMFELYINHDLNGLIEELNNYFSKEESEKIILMFDYLHYSENIKGKPALKKLYKAKINIYFNKFNKIKEKQKVLK